MTLERQVLVPTPQSASSSLVCDMGLILPPMLAFAAHYKDREILGVKAKGEYQPPLPITSERHP